jgi:multidrug resistance efflux pump
MPDADPDRVLGAAGRAAHRGDPAKAPGTLLSLRVAEGSRVKAGQALGEIDLADLQSRVLDRSALVDSAQANVIEAERQHDRERRSGEPELHLAVGAADFAGAARRGACATESRRRRSCRRLASACARPRWSRRSPASSAAATSCRAKRSVPSSSC